MKTPDPAVVEDTKNRIEAALEAILANPKEDLGAIHAALLSITKDVEQAIAMDDNFGTLGIQGMPPRIKFTHHPCGTAFWVGKDMNSELHPGSGRMVPVCPKCGSSQ